MLRRVIEHVKTQNWTAIALDFAIVVFGVFMGIQLGNWNDARSANAAETSYLKRYHEDLTATLEMFDVRLKLIDQQLAEVPNAISAPENAAAAWAIVRAQYVISGITPPEVRTATYTDMVSSGRLTLVSDEALRARLVEHYSRDGAYPVLESEPPFRQMVRGVIPQEWQDYLTSDACLVDFETYVACPAPQGAQNLMDVATVLATDVALTRALNFNISHHRISRKIIVSIIAQTDALRADIEAALERKGVEP
ncbi:MAG: hypothetical protein AAGJ87_01885 [Pseudomonadota bacterium]